MTYQEANDLFYMLLKGRLIKSWTWLEFLKALRATVGITEGKWRE